MLLISQGGTAGVKGTLNKQVVYLKIMIIFLTQVMLASCKYYSGHWAENGRVHSWAKGNKSNKLCKMKSALFIIIIIIIISWGVYNLLNNSEMLFYVGTVAA